MIKYSIVMPALNEEKYIGRTLQSLRPQLDDETEIIVVDNESRDRTADIAREHGVRVVYAPRGKLNARDAGIRAAAGDIIIATDADCNYPYGWLARMKAYFDNPDIVGVGGSRSYERGAHWLQWFPLPRFFGGNSAFRKQAYYDSGGFDLTVNQRSLIPMVREEEMKFKRRLKKFGKVKIDRKLRVITSSRRFTDPEFKRQIKEGERF